MQRDAVDDFVVGFAKTVAVANVGVIDAAMVLDTIEGPLDEGADVVGPLTGQKHAGLLQDDIAIVRHAIGRLILARRGARGLNHGGNWKEFTLAEGITVELEFAADGAQFEPTNMARGTFQAGLAFEAGYGVGVGH